MMKKHVFIFTALLITTIFMSVMQIYAYSPHYLPGGKNYLSNDNFIAEGAYYNSVDPFLVKPYTDYTITVPRLYSDEQWEYFTIEMFENDTFHSSIEIENLEMVSFYDGSNEWFYYTFKTTSQTNYLYLSFDNNSGYFTSNGMSQTQLEEGLVYTGYEAYLEGSLIDTSAPYFQNASTIVSYFDSPITAAQIQSSLVAYDAIDGNMTSNISLVQDNYSSFSSTLGDYTLIFEVSDTSNNTSQITITVQVVDVLKPVFSELGTILAVYPNVYSTVDILDMLTASDNYDGDISSQIIMESDNYSSNSSIVGDYQMTFSVADSSGNVQTYTQEISVVDSEAPIISGVTSIVIGYDSEISIEDILENLDCNDNYDVTGLDFVLESDDYTNNQHYIGDYEMVFSVTDSSGNKTFQTITIDVVDEIGPVVYFNSSIIQTYTDTVMALPDFILLLRNAREIDRFEDYYVTARYDSYTNNAAVPGVYHLKLTLTNDLGENIEKNLEIKVIDRPIDFIQIGETNTDENVRFYDRYSEIIIGSSLGLFLVVSNVVWLVVLKKRS